MALSKNQIKFICSLHQKKHRTENGLFIAEGEKVVKELLLSSLKIESIYATKNFADQNQEFNTTIITEDELTKISALTTPNEVLAIAQIPHYKIDRKEIADSLSLVLDEIQDPGNLGTIIRIADWFGIKNIICSENSVDPFNPKVVQATMGSIFRVKIHHTDLKLFLETENSLEIYGAVLNGENIYEEKLTGKGLIILGNESKGISKELLPFITHKIKIPSHDHSKAESLNIASATAIICYEFRRNHL